MGNVAAGLIDPVIREIVEGEDLDPEDFAFRRESLDETLALVHRYKA